MHQFLVILVILTYPLNAFACSCDRTATDESRFNEADTVLLAEVTNTRLVKTSYEGEELEIVEADFKAIEIFKEGAETTNFVRGLSFGFGNCSVGLMSGMEYIFYISTENEEYGEEFNYFVNMCDGSTAVNIHRNNFEEELEKLRNFGKK